MPVWKPHVTVASVIENQGRFLCVEEQQDGLAVFNQPAGHMEDQETLVAAAIRETYEETGYHFQPQALVGIYQWRLEKNGKTYLRFTFCGTAEEPSGEVSLDPDIIATHWLSPQELAERPLRSPLVQKSIDDYLANTRLPLSLIQTLYAQ